MATVLELSLPTSEPIAATDVQAWLKLPDGHPDLATIVPRASKAARRQIETWTGITLAKRKFVQYQDGFPFFPYFQSPYAPLFGAAFPFYFGYGPIASYPYPAIGGLQNQMLDPFSVRALRNPVTSITAIDYIGTDGNKHSLVPFKDFVPDFATGRVVPLPGQRWPVSILGPNTVKVFFEAGYEPDGTTAPEEFESSPGWEPEEELAQYAYLIDKNGNVQMQTVGPSATTGTVEPTFGEEPGDVTSGDGSAQWICLGPVLGKWDPQNEYVQYGVVFDSNGNLQTLVVARITSEMDEPAFSQVLGVLSNDGGVTGAWRCLGEYEGVIPVPPDQPNSYIRTSVCPEDLQMAILLLTSHYYFNRDAVVAGSATSVPLGVESIVNSLRDFGFAPQSSV